MRESPSFSFNRRRWMSALTLTASVALASGCVIESSTCDDGGGPSGSGMAGAAGGTSTPAQQVILATIDTNGTMETVPGEGIGAFIEYGEGGRWHVYTACDTDLSDLPCYFNVIAILPEGASYSSLTPESLESDDDIIEYNDGLELITETGSDIDGMSFNAPEGGVVRFEVYLDGEADARFIYWVGGGAVHGGAPSNPIDLKPTEP
jgi:hypothetical protein